MMELKKRSPRKGANVCPTDGAVMRVVFISRDVGGFTALPGFVGCPICKNVRKVVYQDVVEVISHRIVNVQNETEINVEKPDAAKE